MQARGLAHPEHWLGPQGQLFERFGAVKASPMAAYKLLRQGESVLLFPGGGREVHFTPVLAWALRLNRVLVSKNAHSACILTSEPWPE